MTVQPMLTPAILAAALRMTDDQAALILTETDEPELIAEPGDQVAGYAADEIAAARVRSSWSRPPPEESAAMIAAAAYWKKRGAAPC